MADSYESQKGVHCVMSPSKGGIVNLGSFIRSSDGGGVQGVAVADPVTGTETGLNLTIAE